MPNSPQPSSSNNPSPDPDTDRAPKSAWPHSLLYYRQPTTAWIQGLPIGNGVLGAMVVGTPVNGRLALNHEGLWRGRGRDRTIEPRHQHLEQIRELFFAGRTRSAGDLANAKLGGGGGASGRPSGVDPYQPAGDLFIETEHTEFSDYHRWLDLDRALCGMDYHCGDTRHSQQCFAHADAPVIALRLCAEGGTPVRARLRLDRIADEECVLNTHAQEDTLTLRGRFDEGVAFSIMARVICDNTVHPANAAAIDIEAHEALILLTMAVDPDGGDTTAQCRAVLDQQPSAWEELLQGHMERHRSLYRRVRIELGEERSEPTDRRLANLRDSADDEGLLATHANFGRYLLIASSRAGGLPANLQGIWNDRLRPPWKSDFHHDINLQMNYWPAEVCGLVECLEPLYEHIRRLVPGGREMARLLFDCRGVYNCIQTDRWERPTPESNGYDVWTGAAAWLAQHLWWRYEFGLDQRFLRKVAYPYFKEVAAFYEDFLVTDPRSGHLVTVPSQSPENKFVGGCTPVSLCVAATMDIELIHDVLGHAIEAARVLGVDADQRLLWASMLERLPPLRVGRHGQLQEWLEDYEEVEPGHRHLSHLFGLFPGDQLTPEHEPELTAAAKVSLDRRVAAADAAPDGHCGWSRAWTVCCRARLRAGDDARDHLRKLLTDFTSNSLLDLHPDWSMLREARKSGLPAATKPHTRPPWLFEIDGNFGAAAGLFEMLLQSHRGCLRILPALPAAWPSGSVHGLRARGGFIVDIQWAKGRPVGVGITSLAGSTCAVRCPGATGVSMEGDGSRVDCKQLPDGGIAFETSAKQSYRLTFQ